MTARLLIADDHVLVLDALASTVAADAHYSVITESNGARLPEHLLGPNPPALIVLDWHLPGCDVEALIRECAAPPRSIPVIVLSGTEAIGEVAARALDAGALGFVHKRDATARLMAAIAQVLDGRVFMTTETAMAASAWRRHAGQTRPELSMRQGDVLALLAQGLSNAAIGERLRIAESTVKSHVTGLMSALGADNRTACVSRARQLGLLD